jgi:hypothetical protein
LRQIRTFCELRSFQGNGLMVKTYHFGWKKEIGKSGAINILNKLMA